MWISLVYKVMKQAQRHTFQVLTKRPLEMLQLATASPPFPVLPNVWWGVSVEDRARMDRINPLRAMPGPVRFLSLEPLLENLGKLDLTRIDWVIVGGESGPGARPMHPNCVAADVPFFFKQWGDWVSSKGLRPPDTVDHVFPDFYQMSRVGKKRAGRVLDGETWDQMPDGREP